MEDALAIKKPVKLIVYDCPGEKSEYVKAMLTVVSGLNVKRGGLLVKKFYAYFDNVESANVAAHTAVGMTCCRTKVRTGIFKAKNVMNDTITHKDFHLQNKVLKTKIVKNAIVAVNATRNTSDVSLVQQRPSSNS